MAGKFKEIGLSGANGVSVYGLYVNNRGARVCCFAIYNKDCWALR